MSAEPDHSGAALTSAGTLDAMPGNYVTTAEAAAAVGISHTTLMRWARRGLVKPSAKTPGGQYRWDLDDLRQQLRDLAEGE